MHYVKTVIPPLRPLGLLRSLRENPVSRKERKGLAKDAKKKKRKIPKY
jgi:hypothetical protein